MNDYTKPGTEKVQHKTPLTFHTTFTTMNKISTAAKEHAVANAFKTALESADKKKKRQEKTWTNCHDRHCQP